MNEARIRIIGRKILEQKPEGFNVFSPKQWANALMDKMVGNDTFRVASLRFVDVAPTLRNDDEFMDHLSGYFGESSPILRSFMGDSIPGTGLLGKMIVPLARRNIEGMAKTFIAGESVESGLANFQKLHEQGYACSIDLLGEAVITKAEAEHFTTSYHTAIKTLANATREWTTAKYPEDDRAGKIARTNVSIKLSALYEHVNPTAHRHSVDTLCERFRSILDTAMEHGTYVHVDMEQFNIVPITLDVFQTVLMEEKYQAYPHVGIVCQAYLKDSGALLKHLIKFSEKRGTPISIRLVKGAYWDYEQAHAQQQNWRCPVFDNKYETDANFEKLTIQILKAFPKVRPCIGTHNARSLAVAISTAEELNLERGDVEFQMLNGMAETFRLAVKNMGYRVRVYCPVGEFIPGMSYLVRRLLENTANQSFLKMHKASEQAIEELLDDPRKKINKNDNPTPYAGFKNQPLKDFSNTDHRLQARKAIDGFDAKLPIDVKSGINGKVIKGKGTETHRCPWDDRIIVSNTELTTKKSTEEAIQSAKNAFPKWRDLGKANRAAILQKAAKLCERDWAELFALQVYEAGKDWVHADADIAEGLDFMRFYAEQIQSIDKLLQPNSLWGEENTTIYEPRGVMAVIAPWNFPFAISAGMTSAALAAGNTVLYKPAEQTSALGQKLYEIYLEAGVPKEAFHFIPGKGEDVGAYMVEHKDIAGVAFTGSREVGLHILDTTGKIQKGQEQAKKCIIEMGGKNALIIDSDADLDEAVPATVQSAFGFQGQKCSACSRVIVVGSAYKPFAKRIKELVEGLRVGPSNDPEFDVNAVIDFQAKKKIENYIKLGEKEATLLARAPKPATVSKNSGQYVLPSVFTNVNANSKLTKEEIFGPVLAIYHAKTIEEAVKMASDNDYALTGGLFSRNPKTINYVKQNYRVGNLYINRGITGALVSRQPFGGGKMSGTGTKAGGVDYLLNFMEARVITENTMRRGFAPEVENG